jgi:hypothetical protein
MHKDARKFLIYSLTGNQAAEDRTVRETADQGSQPQTAADGANSATMTVGFTLACESASASADFLFKSS